MLSHSLSSTVYQVFCYPIKGLTPQPLRQAQVFTNRGIAGDRAFALMFTDGDRQPVANTPWLPKRYFAVQNDWMGLAKLSCHYDAATQELTILMAGVRQLHAHVDRDRAAIDEFFSDYLRTLTPTPGARHPQVAPVQLVGLSSGETRFPDTASGQISIIGSATLRAIAEAVGETAIDPRRFRPNLILKTREPWEEFSWIGQRLTICSGSGDASDKTLGKTPNKTLSSIAGDVNAPSGGSTIGRATMGNTADRGANQATGIAPESPLAAQSPDSPDLLDSSHCPHPPVELIGLERIERCLNIEVCPTSGDRNLPILKALKQRFHHTDTGIFAQVVSGGTIAVGDSYSVQST